MNDSVMASIFMDPIGVRAAVTGMQEEYAATEQLRADLERLIPLSIDVVKVTKSTWRPAQRPQAKRGVFTVTASDKGNRRRNQKSGASVNSASIGDDTTLSTKMTISSTRTVAGSDRKSVV